MLSYSIIKALHIIFVVSYFAGIFYIVRLFIYHTEALEESEPKRSILHQQFAFMEERLWNIITVPAFIIMIITGFLMIYLGEWALLQMGWFHIKLFFLFLLFYYHFWCWKMIKRLKNEQITLTSVKLRMMNEVATIILFVVVFAVTLKYSFVRHWYWAFIFFILMGILIMSIVKLVNRNKK
ncbi:MAG: CopD family protein [Capnocytophaga sp.]|nr:CopD family protein [Capnocytophaga sp.]